MRRYAVGTGPPTSSSGGSTRMNHQPEASTRGLARGLGLTSIALAAGPLLRPAAIARLTGTDDSSTSSTVIRMVGARELAHAAALLAGPPAMVWTRVLGDAADLTLLERARR